MRPIKPQTLALFVATLVLVLLNVPFWRQLIRAVNPANAYEWLFLVSVFLVAGAGYTMVLSAFAFRPILKPVAVFLILLTAITSYFIGEYGIAIDASMLQNIFETDPTEVYEFVTPKLFLHVAAMGVLPAIIVCLIPVAWGEPRRIMLASGAVAGAALVFSSMAVAPFAMNYSSVFREHKKLRLLLSPYNVFAAADRLARLSIRPAVAAISPFGGDARQRPSVTATRTVTVLVVGETARAANFSLNGYGRQTNPQLADHVDLISFTNARSCGTSTAESLPCMFSGLGRQHHKSAAHSSQEGLLDILHRAGLAVLWRDNQSGCKGVCARIPTELLKKTRLVDEGDQSYDEVLLDGLEARIAGTRKDAVIVLHMMGSHGPAYYKRYPAAFEAFKPACKTSQFSRCTHDAIVNAYDNTIAYTDHVLSRLIGILKRSDERGIGTSMIYVSDHGESLGENGLYLHGLPYAIAPAEQKHVPLMIWLSRNFKEASGTSQHCLERGRERPFSHDNIFHTVLGMSRVETKVYDPKLDILAGCRELVHGAIRVETIPE